MKKLFICFFTILIFTSLSLFCSGKPSFVSDNETVDTVVDDEIDSIVDVQDRTKSDFNVVITGDTVYFDIVDDGVSIVYWNRTNFDNHILNVPSQVTYQGKTYPVVEIGDEAMGVEYYNESEMDNLWEGNDHMVEKVILPTSVRRIGDAAFTARLRTRDYLVELTDSIEYIGSCAVNCMYIRDKKDAVILPANLKRIGWLLDDEDHEIDGEYVDFVFSKLYIPEHLEKIGGLDNFYRDQPRFKKIEVHPRNKHFKTINGVLYSYNLDSIYWSTMNENLYIPKDLCVDKSTIYFLEDGWYSHIQMPKLKSIKVHPDNPYCIAIDNMLYDKKNKCLIMAALDGKRKPSVHVPSWCNDVKTIYPFQYCFTDSSSLHFVFSNEAPIENVVSFIHALIGGLDVKGNITFTYKGTTWDCNQKMPDFK